MTNVPQFELRILHIYMHIYVIYIYYANIDCESNVLNLILIYKIYSFIEVLVPGKKKELSDR